MRWKLHKEHPRIHGWDTFSAFTLSCPSAPFLSRESSPLNWLSTWTDWTYILASPWKGKRLGEWWRGLSLAWEHPARVEEKSILLRWTLESKTTNPFLRALPSTVQISFAHIMSNIYLSICIIYFISFDLHSHSLSYSEPFLFPRALPPFLIILPTFLCCHCNLIKSPIIYLQCPQPKVSFFRSSTHARS